MKSWRVLWPIHNLREDHCQYPGVMGLAALLAADGFEQEVVPADYAAISGRLRDGRLTVLAYSMLSCFASRSLELNRRLKADFPGAFALFGGPHPTFFPEMIDEPGVDALCLGEGEHAMLDLLRALEARGAVTGIANLWIKRDGRVQRNPVRPLVANLDELPIPDHALFRRAMSREIRQAVVITGRGCPYRCTYCYNHAYRKLYAGKGRMVRQRSVPHVMAELRQLKAAGCRYVRFMDDLFILSPAWIAEFAAIYKTDIGIPFTCMVRANHVTPEIMRMLRGAGCFRVLMGLEAGNDHVRNEILKRDMSREEILRAARCVRAAGVKLVTANIIGIPGGSFRADWETVQFNRQCRPHFASVALMNPYPRTEIHDIAAHEGMLDREHMDKVLRSGGFGHESPLRFKDPREQRMTENLHRLFSLAIALPWLIPLVRILVRLPPNRVYDRLYIWTVTLGQALQEVPPGIGLPLLWRKTPVYRAFDFVRRRRTTIS